MCERPYEPHQRRFELRLDWLSVARLGVVVPSDSPLAAPLASPVEPVSSSTAHEYRSFSSLLPNQHERGWLGNSNYSLFSEHLRGWV